MASVLLALLISLPVGEKLTYRVKFGPLTAGTLTLELAGEEPIDEEVCFHLLARLKSNPSYSALFTIDDRLESYARTSDFITLRTGKNVREGRYQNEEAVEFDYSENIARYSDGVIAALPGESRDVLSLWYYIRSRDFAVGDEFVTFSHADKKNYDVNVLVTGRRTVETILGTMSCLVFQMQSTGPAGSGSVFVSDDERRLPVLIRTKMGFGYLTATLSEVEDGTEE